MWGNAVSIVVSHRRERGPVCLVAILAAFVATDGCASAPYSLQPPPQGSAPAPSAPPGPPQTEPTPPADLAGPAVLRGDQIALLMQTLSDVDAEGFPKDAFTPPGLDALLRSPSLADRKRGQGLLRGAVLAYARVQHGGRIPVSAFNKNWGLRPAHYDPAPEFDQAVSVDALDRWIQSLAPPFDRYRGLRDALARYRQIAAQGGWGSVPGGARLAEGDKGPRVDALRRRLAAEDATLGEDRGEGYDQALADAVRTFQHNVGLTPTGVADLATVAALNVPVRARLVQIEANMERWRWVPRTMPDTRIETNIASEEMTAFQDGSVVLEMRAAPGRTDDQTPMLASAVQSIVFDPPWNVPASIATKELWPKETAHPGYLASHGYKVVSSASDGSVRIIQPYGPKSALGSIKFDFANAYSVYLHDTPSRAAFSRGARAVSHGCVRLQRPRELAALLLQDQGDWSAERIASTIARRSTERVVLTRPMPIYLLYWTAFLDVKGRVNFRNDVYGWDAELMRLIAAAPG